MVNLQLLDIVTAHIPEFNPESEADLIKAEKILKAESKTDETLLLNEVNNFLDFLKQNGNKYLVFFRDENLSKILRNDYFKIDSSKNRIHHENSEIKTDFGEDFSESIQNYIRQNIQNNDWSNLRIFYKNYFSIISFDNQDELLEVISDKNRLIQNTIPQTNLYPLFLSEYQFAINPDFYALQSDIDSHYFNEDILDINNTLSQNQKVENQYKVFLGKIFVALAHFDAFTEDLRNILKKNASIGKKWANKESKIDKIIDKNKIDTQKDHGKTAEWIILSIFYALIGFGLYKMYVWNSSFLIILLVVELLTYIFANKKLNQHFEEESKSQNDQSFRRKLKKFSFKLVMLQLYTLVVAIFLGIIGALIAVAIATGGSGAIVIIIIARFIYSAAKKK